MPDSKLLEVYGKVPGIKCKGLCAASCNFIVIGRKERRSLDNAGITGNFVPHEEYDNVLGTQGVDRKCSMLSDCGKCTIYNERPLICRMFGTTKMMKCPFGCEPEKWLTDIQAKKLMIKVGMG